MRIGMLAPVAWRTPPRHYGPWEQVASLLTEELVRTGVDVTLFATADSQTTGRLDAVVEKGYEEQGGTDAKVLECLHIANCFEKAAQFDLIHNHFDFLPLTYSPFVTTPVLTTIHGFSSPQILPVYRKYNGQTRYVSISDADRAAGLDYVRTVYHGIDMDQFTFRSTPGSYLLFLGRIHPDKGTHEAIRIAREAGRELVIAGIIQDPVYFAQQVEPFIDGKNVHYIGHVGPRKRDEVMGGALALLHPIRFNEPFGLSVVEAMACGTPTIALRRGSMPEIIDHGSNGFLSDSIDACVTMVERVPYIDRARCRETVQKRFTVQRMARDYMSVYRQILESREDQGNTGAW